MKILNRVFFNFFHSSKSFFLVFLEGKENTLSHLLRKTQFSTLVPGNSTKNLMQL